MPTKIINLFGGPCSGKSTFASYLFSKMKILGYKVELVTEYAKELVYDERMNILSSDQLYILAKQNRKLKKLIDKVEYIITDSPLLLSLIYDELMEYSQPSGFREYVLNLFKSYNNINIFLKRDFKFQSYGRINTEEESEDISYKILKYFNYFDIHYIDFDYKIEIDKKCDKLLKMI